MPPTAVAPSSKSAYSRSPFFDGIVTLYVTVSLRSVTPFLHSIVYVTVPVAAFVAYGFLLIVPSEFTLPVVFIVIVVITPSASATAGT